MLYDTLCPRTARNFRELATGLYGFGYANSAFHRVVPDVRSFIMSFFRVQGGRRGLQEHEGRELASPVATNSSII